MPSSIRRLSSLRRADLAPYSLFPRQICIAQARGNSEYLFVFCQKRGSFKEHLLLSSMCVVTATLSCYHISLLCGKSQACISSWLRKQVVQQQQEQELCVYASDCFRYCLQSVITSEQSPARRARSSRYLVIVHLMSQCHLGSGVMKSW